MSGKRVGCGATEIVIRPRYRDDAPREQVGTGMVLARKLSLRGHGEQ
jgi:hypothetical protein